MLPGTSSLRQRNPGYVPQHSTLTGTSAAQSLSGNGLPKGYAGGVLRGQSGHHASRFGNGYVSQQAVEETKQSTLHNHSRSNGNMMC
jgi:hypothetical protein